MPATWQTVWRRGFLPHLKERHLLALKSALQNNDPTLIQGATTSPPPLQCVQHWPVEAACLLSYMGWKGDALDTVAEVEDFFARLCFQAEKEIGEPAAHRWLLNFWDESDRAEAVAALLEEVNRALELEPCGAGVMDRRE
jgi:hypothetical protein